MTAKLYEEITAGLKTVKDCTAYPEDIPQNFAKPCFQVTLCGQKFSRGINKSLKYSVEMDVLYYPENETEYQKE